MEEQIPVEYHQPPDTVTRAVPIRSPGARMSIVVDAGPGMCGKEHRREISEAHRPPKRRAYQLPPEGAKARHRYPKRLSEATRKQTVVQNGSQPPDPFRTAPSGSPENQIVSRIEHGQQPGHRLRRMVAVVVDGYDHRSFGGGDTDKGSVSLAPAFGKYHESHLSARLCKALQTLPPRSPAAVVDQYNL